MDNRHLIHCTEYRKNLPTKEVNKLEVLDTILTTSTIYLTKDHSFLTLPNGKRLDFLLIDGVLCTFLPQLAEALEEKYGTLWKRYDELTKEKTPEILRIRYQKKITSKRLLREFSNLLPVDLVEGGRSRILVREDDMLYLAATATKLSSRMSLRYLIDYSITARNWITDLIYKLGKCNNREFKFLCAWLRLGWALEEITPQRWYRLPTTYRRIAFRLHEGELLVEIDARDIEIHDPYRDKTTDRWFFEKGKLLIRFMNSEIDKNPLKCVRETINIAKGNGIIIKQEVLPNFIKGFIKKNKETKKPKSV